MNFKSFSKKYWWVYILVILAIFGNLIKKEPVRDYIGEATQIIQKLRNPTSVDVLSTDYQKAEVLFNEMKIIKDSTSNDWESAKMELEALIANKQKNINQASIDIKVKKLFSSYDGHNIYLERAVKERMNNPKSYEHVATKYEVDGNKIKVYSQFRGTNGFNAIILTDAYAEMDFDGNITNFKFPASN